MYTTLGAPSGARGGSNGPQSGTESRMSTLILPLNGSGTTSSSQLRPRVGFAPNLPPAVRPNLTRSG